MLPIHELSAEIATYISIVFTDIDDTLSSAGKILPEAYNALWQLHNAGLKIIPITGRAAGHVDHIARFWPVAAVIGENGAFYAYMETVNGQSVMRKRYFMPLEETNYAKQKFQLIQKEVFEKFPTCRLASDQNYREFDLAIDFCEDVPALSLTQVDEIVKIYEKYGAQTKVSSIHVNGWFGEYDKLSMTKLYALEQLGLQSETLKKKALFIGDSPNDQPMFKFFPFSVGVANIRRFSDHLTYFPKYISQKEAGKGFAETVQHLLSLRKKS
ncbi:MAG: HAD-IIB family hydrolase [Promethearchaeota archaeon]